MVKGLASIIVPCYNHGKYLKETVESALNSEYPHLEVIIVNDGSSDDSEEVALELVNKYPQVRYFFQENQGPSVARNHGINESCGEYILPLDADDLISPQYISLAISELNDHSVKLVYCEAEFFGERSGKWILKPFSHKLLARDNMIFCSAVYRKTDWKNAGGYDEGIIWGWEDWEFWISLLKSGGKVIKIPQTCFYYRIHSVSRRKKMSSNHKKQVVAFINKKHKEFIYSQLKGPMRIPRTWSRIINTFLNVDNDIK